MRMWPTTGMPMTCAANKPATCDPAEVHRALTTYLPPGRVTEIRALDCTVAGDRFAQTYSGYFNDIDAAVKAVQTIQSAKGIYFLPNDVNPDLLARAVNRIRAAKKSPLTSDSDIIRRRFIPIDIDPTRAADIASNDAEHGAAISTAHEIDEYLQSNGWPAGIVGDSGNGANVVYAIDLPADDSGLVERCLKRLGEIFDNERVNVDPTTCNPARLWRIPGTLNAKGDDAAGIGRPHRMARLLEIPQYMALVSRELLEALAGPATATPVHSNGKAHNGNKFDLPTWIRQHNLNVTGPDNWNGGRKWVFNVCPFDSAHTNRSAFIGQLSSGAITGGCHHNSCSGKGWPEIRAMFEPARQDTHRNNGATNKTNPANATNGPAKDDFERFTELEDARELCTEFAGTFHYHHERGIVLVRNEAEGRWIEDKNGFLQRCAKMIGRNQWDKIAGAKSRKDAIRHATRSESAQGIAAMISLAKSEPGITVTASMMDANQWELNTLAGVLDLRNGELRAHSSDDLFTKLAPVCFAGQDAPCPRWELFLNQIMARNARMITYLQRVFGLCLTGDISVQELWVFHGPGANGKSVLLDTFDGLLGDYAGLAPPGLLTARANEQHPTELADLQGRRLVIGSETEEGATLRLQLVKRLTGDSTLKGRFMRQDFFEFPRTHKLILATNNRPRIPENTRAVWRRLRLVPFNVTIAADEQDPRLLDKLRVEWPGILAWAVRGCLDWQREGLQTPPEVMQATEEYQSEQDPLAEYLAARCVLGERVKAGRVELFGDYQSWATQTNDRHPLERNAFYDRIRRIDGITEDQFRPLGSSSPVRGFIGIGLLHSGGAQ